MKLRSLRFLGQLAFAAAALAGAIHDLGVRLVGAGGRRGEGHFEPLQELLQIIGPDHGDASLGVLVDVDIPRALSWR